MAWADGSEQGWSSRTTGSCYQSLVRDSSLARFLKSLYDFRCQVCEGTFRLSSGSRYAECHHLRPLGRPHGGEDTEKNIMVLCPNHHAMMDLGVLAIRPHDYIMVTFERRRPENNQPIRLVRHPIERDYVEYHYSEIFGKVG
ncbi:MAG: HNH endonuclease [Chloroflexi bacterium]|nr:HNH endonuclease [Chloroflexota bacterium]